MKIRITPHRIAVVFWFLKRPRLYPQLLRETKSAITRKRHPTLETSIEAESWCEERATTSEKAYDQLGINPGIEVKTKYANEYRSAYQLTESLSIDWGGEGHGELLYNIICHNSFERLAESGVAYGWSTLGILLAIKNNKRAHLHSIDMPYFRADERLVGCAVPDYLKNKWTLYPYADREGIPKVIRKLGTIDVFHYDSDKSYQGRLWAYEEIWGSLSHRGYLISDDVGDNLAFKEFSEKIKREPMIIEHYDNRRVKYVGLISKGEKEEG